MLTETPPSPPPPRFHAPPRRAWWGLAPPPPQHRPTDALRLQNVQYLSLSCILPQVCSFQPAIWRPSSLMRADNGASCGMAFFTPCFYPTICTSLPPFLPPFLSLFSLSVPRLFEESGKRSLPVTCHSLYQCCTSGNVLGCEAPYPSVCVWRETIPCNSLLR